MASYAGYTTNGTVAISPSNTPGDHAACDAVFARMRERAERAEARLAEIETHTSAIVDALRHALSYVEYAPHPSSQTAAERYRSALAIIGTGQERHG